MELKISPKFTIDDIHKIREYNYEKTKDMTVEEVNAYYNAGAQKVQSEIDAIRRAAAKSKA